MPAVAEEIVEQLAGLTLDEETAVPIGDVVRRGFEKDPGPPDCDRLIHHDSIAWRCACGARGPVGRSADGVPFVDAEILRHKPGRDKE